MMAAMLMSPTFHVVHAYTGDQGRLSAHIVPNRITSGQRLSQVDLGTSWSESSTLGISNFHLYVCKVLLEPYVENITSPESLVHNHIFRPMSLQPPPLA